MVKYRLVPEDDNVMVEDGLENDAPEEERVDESE